MAIEKIIWDVSGTLWNDKPQVFNAMLLCLRGLKFIYFPKFRFGEYSGQELSVKGLIANAKGSSVEMFRDFGVAKKDYSDDKLQEMYAQQLATACKKFPVELYFGVSQMLTNVANRLGSDNMSVVSAHPQERLMEDFERLGLLGRVFKEEKVFGDVCDKREKIQELSGLPMFGISNSCVYIGDTMSDMKSAKSAGVTPIGVSYGYQSEEQVRSAEAEKVFSTPTELHSYLLEKIKHLS